MIKKIIISTISLISLTILSVNSFADNSEFNKLNNNEINNEKPIDGKIIFQQKGCTACHGPNLIGPTVEKIASAYKGKENDLIKFLKGEGKAIVNPENESWMKAQIKRTKSMSDEELKALVKFILSSNQEPIINNKQK